MRSMIRVAARALAAVLAGLLTLAPAAADPPTAVKVSEAVRGFFFVPLYIAKANGHFAERGLEVEIVSMQGGPKAMAALVSGDVQFCATGHGQVANLHAQGKPTKIINAMMQRVCFSLIARPEIGSLADLKGKKIGCTQLGSESHGIARYLAKSAGLDADTDVSYVAVGGADKMAAALQAGSIDATVCWQPGVIKLVDAGKAKVLASLSSAADSQKHLGSEVYSFSVIHVTPEYLAANRDVAERFVASLVAAEKWLATADLAEAAQKLAPFFEGTPADVIQRSLEADKAALSTDGRVSQAGHDAAIAVFRAAGVLKADVPFAELVDNSLVEKAHGGR